MAGAHALQEFDERALLVFGEVSDGEIIGLPHLFFELGQHLEPAWRDVAEHLTAVGRRPIAPSKPGLLEFVEQARDARSRVDHPVANDERRQPFVAGAAQNSQNVVLLHGDAGPGDDLREMALDQRGRSEDAHRDFCFYGMEGPALDDLRLDPAVIVFV